MHNIQQSTIGDIASRFEKTLIDTPDHRREARAKELAVKANQQISAIGGWRDFTTLIPMVLRAIRRYEAGKAAKQAAQGEVTSLQQNDHLAQCSGFCHATLAHKGSR